jgi:hypothetical protein
MHDVLDRICVALDETATRINALGPSSKTLREELNWQFPALTRADLAGLASQLAIRLREADISDVGDIEMSGLADVPRRLQLLWTDTIPQINGQPAAMYAYTESINALERALAPFISMVNSEDTRYLPAKIVSRIKAANRRIDRIETDEAGLQGRVEEINRAYSVAEKLPTTLQELDDARAELEEIRSKIEKIHEDSTKIQGRIELNETLGDTYLLNMNKLATEAERLIKKCEDAYQITTTKGLAGAFDQRAVRLNVSIVLWVAGLLVALYFGAEFGSKRIDALSKLTSDGRPEWGIILMHVILSVLSVGGPLWFAWLATKQIGQRFRLAEDYAYKASVAKAYEGYRKQAEKLDESFAARLFSSALTRLDEAPLRLVEPDTHGSPWHEMLKSETIQRAAAMGPKFQEDVLDLARRTIDIAKSSVSARTKATDSAEAAVTKNPE